MTSSQARCAASEAATVLTRVAEVFEQRFETSVRSRLSTGEYAMNKQLSKRVLTVLLCCLLVPFAAQADSYSPTGQSNEQAPATAPAPQLSPQQIQQLVAPIALYPDALVAQVLAASTYPAEIVEAD